MIRKELEEVIVTILFAVFLALVIRIVWAHFGFTLVVVEGHSMEPLFQSGDLVLVQKVPPDQIHIGDIIVYRGCGGHLIIHRVVDICKGGSYCFLTWGDNNRIPDTADMICSTCVCELRVANRPIFWPGVPYSRVVGKVVEIGGYIYKIPYIGALSIIFKG